MTTLTQSKTSGERTFYEPVLTRITGVSQYNATQYRLEGIDGFWDAGERQVAQAVKDGAVAWFTLAEKPKTGPRAKPGSKYQDIVDIQPANPDDKAGYEAPQSHASGSNGSYAGKELAASSDALPAAYDRHGNPMRDGSGQPTSGYWIHRDEQIVISTAYNNLTHMLASGFWANGNEPDFDAYGMWLHWFGESSRGLPLTPVPDDVDLGSTGEVADEAPATPEQLPWDDAPEEAQREVNH